MRRRVRSHCGTVSKKSRFANGESDTWHLGNPGHSKKGGYLPDREMSTVEQHLVAGWLCDSVACLLLSEKGATWQTDSTELKAEYGLPRRTEGRSVKPLEWIGKTCVLSFYPDENLDDDNTPCKLRR